VTVRAENLGPCQDTRAVSHGCGSGQAPAEPAPTPTPVTNVVLLLEQGSRSWTLGVGDASAPDYTITYPADLPEALTPGRATLRLTGSGLLGEPYVRLQVAAG